MFLMSLPKDFQHVIFFNIQTYPQSQLRLQQLNATSWRTSRTLQAVAASAGFFISANRGQIKRSEIEKSQNFENLLNFVDSGKTN